MVAAVIYCCCALTAVSYSNCCCASKAVSYKLLFMFLNSCLLYMVVVVPQQLVAAKVIVIVLEQLQASNGICVSHKRIGLPLDCYLIEPCE